jgi:putative membrane protein
MLPQGFFGTRADILMDLVIVAFIIILPVLTISWSKARQKKYPQHRGIQLWLGSILGVAVILFEVDLKMSGGMAELTKDSPYFDTALLNGWIYGHTLVAILTTIIWVVLIIMSLRRFGNPPSPNDFSGKHRFWGRTGMTTMFITGVSAFPLYYYGFWVVG